MINLKNKKILIIGCGAIGGAAAEILNELGAKVVISDKDELVLDKILSSLDKRQHHKVVFDVRQVDQIKNFIKKVVSVDGLKLDGLVYAVDKNLTASLMDTSLELLQDVMMVNFFAFIEVIKVFISEEVYNPNSSIVAVSSY